MKVIFLDIDGVLNTGDWREATQDYFDKPICRRHMPYLKRIVEEGGYPRIVLSSSWRGEWNEGEAQSSETGEFFNKIFAEYNLEIYSKTFDDLRSYDRKLEIDAWLEEHKNEVEAYVVLDDTDYGFDSSFFVKTVDEEGLNEATADAAIRILSGGCNKS